MLQLLLRNIRLNQKTGFYDAHEAGAKYQVESSLIEGLTEYLKENPTKLIADWYRTLNENDLLHVTKVY